MNSGRPWKSGQQHGGILSGCPVKIGFEYQYDGAGNKLYQRSLHDPDDSQQYSYDSANRLTGFVRGPFDPNEGYWDENEEWVGTFNWCDAPPTMSGTAYSRGQQWDLDGVGNWSAATAYPGDGGAESHETRLDTSFNEYYQSSKSVGGGSPVVTTESHDDNGNLTADAAKQYRWDAFNRLREVRTTTGSLIAFYYYDTGNRRVRKTVVAPGDSNPPVTVPLITDYCYGDWQILEESEGTSVTGNGKPGANPARQFVYGNYIDEVLVMDVNAGGGSTCTDFANGDARYFYHQNSLYSVYALSDANGNIVEAYPYDPYGAHVLILPATGQTAVTFASNNQRIAWGTSPHGNPFTFTGRESDAESGLHPYRNRYCSTERFISRDPFGVKEWPNAYSLCRDNPLSGADPLGLSISIYDAHWGWYQNDLGQRPGIRREGTFDIGGLTTPHFDVKTWTTLSRTSPGKCFVESDGNGGADFWWDSEASRNHELVHVDDAREEWIALYEEQKQYADPDAAWCCAKARCYSQYIIALRNVHVLRGTVKAAMFDYVSYGYRSWLPEDYAEQARYVADLLLAEWDAAQRKGQCDAMPD